MCSPDSIEDVRTIDWLKLGDLISRARPSALKAKKLTSCLGEILEFAGSRNPSETAGNLDLNRIP